MICHGRNELSGSCCFVDGELCPNWRHDPTGRRPYVCAAAVAAIEADPSLVADRERFVAAWAARHEYQPIADAWEARGLPRDYCQVFGPAEGQCCFAEDPATNAARASAVGVT